MASIVYTLNVSYFNQLEEFTKVDTYLDSYAGADATVTKSSEKNYSVVTHVSDAADILLDVFSAIAQIKNLTKVKVIVGEESTEGIDAGTLKEFLADKLHYEITWPAVTAVIEITAGEETATYTLVYSSDYDQIATAKAITDGVLATAHDDEYIKIVPYEDSVEVYLKKPVDQMVDSIGFGDMLKSLDHLKSVTFNMHLSTTGDAQETNATIEAPVTDEKLTQLKTTLSAILPNDDLAILVISTTKFYYDNVYLGDGIDHAIIYEASICSEWIADPEATIGEARYHTVAEALAAAKSGETVKLEKDITISNDQVNATPNSPVIVIPAGITFDGAEHTITADDATWVGTNANHILGVSNVTATIKNVTVIGNAKTKSGIVCFGQTGNATLENVTAQNCGNCGVQVAGATVVATGLHTSGNAWGGVNADKGSDGSTPNLTIGEGCTFAESAEVYTEITDQEVVTAPSLTKYQGFGTNLKGFIYYTSDVSKLGTVYNGAVYETLNDILENNETVDLTVDKDVTENITVPAGKTLNLNLNGKTVANNEDADTLTNNGTLVISGNGVIDNTATRKAALTNNGNLTILGGTISRSQDTGVPDDDTHPGYYTLVNHGTMVIGSEDGDNSAINISSTGGYSALVENGWYDSTGKTAGEDDCTLTIYGGNFSGGKYCVKNDELGNVTIKGGSYAGSFNVNVLNWHNLYIEDGTFDATAKNTANIANGKYQQGVGHIEISGGEFTSGATKTNLIQINGYTSSDITLTGGVFNKKTGLANYLADGYELNTEINPGKFTVAEIEATKIGDETYPSVAAAIAAISDNTPTTIQMLQDVEENVTVPVGKNITINGGENSAKITGGITVAASGAADTNLTVENVELVSPGTSKTYGILSQNQSDDGQMNCNLTLNNVKISGFTSKAIYGTNIKSLTMNGCHIENCATGDMDTPNTKGDYAVDLNLIAVQDAVVTINNTTFTGELGEKAAIKITARGGASDLNASDIPKNVGEATVEKVSITNCDFSGSTTTVDYRIGTDNKTGGDSLNTTGHYAVEIEGNTEMVIQSAYLVDEPTLTVPVGRTASKTADGDIAIDLTVEEQMDAIMEDIPGASETSNNVYSITADNTLDLSFVDEIVAIEGYAGMTITSGEQSASHTAGTPVDTLKSTVQSWLPDANSDPAITLTITANFTE